jgi:hypothetical protein
VLGLGIDRGLGSRTASQQELDRGPSRSLQVRQWVLACLPEMAWHEETCPVSGAVAAGLAAACQEDQAGHLGGQGGRSSCSRDLAHWVGTVLVETIPEGGSPCRIRRVQEAQVQVGPSLAEAGKEGTCWGSGIRVRQVDLGDH